MCEACDACCHYLCTSPQTFWQENTYRCLDYICCCLCCVPCHHKRFYKDCRDCVHEIFCLCQCITCSTSHPPQKEDTNNVAETSPMEVDRLSDNGEMPQNGTLEKEEPESEPESETWGKANGNHDNHAPGVVVETQPMPGEGLSETKELSQSLIDNEQSVFNETCV